MTLNLQSQLKVLQRDAASHGPAPEAFTLRPLAPGRASRYLDELALHADLVLSSLVAQVQTPQSKELIETLLGASLRLNSSSSPQLGSTNPRLSMPVAQVEQLDRDLERVLTLLSPLLNRNQKSHNALNHNETCRLAESVVELLIQKYEIHVYNVGALVAAFLPYHDDPRFARLLQAIQQADKNTNSTTSLSRLSQSGWGFLGSLEKERVLVKRRMLVEMCLRDAGTFERICSTGKHLLEAEAAPHSNSSESSTSSMVSFLTAVLVEVLARDCSANTVQAASPLVVAMFRKAEWESKFSTAGDSHENSDEEGLTVINLREAQSDAVNALSKDLYFSGLSVLAELIIRDNSSQTTKIALWLKMAISSCPLTSLACFHGLFRLLALFFQKYRLISHVELIGQLKKPLEKLFLSTTTNSVLTVCWKGLLISLHRQGLDAFTLVHFLVSTLLSNEQTSTYFGEELERAISTVVTSDAMWFIQAVYRGTLTALSDTIPNANINTNFTNSKSLSQCEETAQKIILALYQAEPLRIAAEMSNALEDVKPKDAGIYQRLSSLFGAAISYGDYYGENNSTGQGPGSVADCIVKLEKATTSPAERRLLRCLLLRKLECDSTEMSEVENIFTNKAVVFSEGATSFTAPCVVNVLARALGEISSSSGSSSSSESARRVAEAAYSLLTSSTEISDQTMQAWLPPRVLKQYGLKLKPTVSARSSEDSESAAVQWRTVFLLLSNAGMTNLANSFCSSLIQNDDDSRAPKLHRLPVVAAPEVYVKEAKDLLGVIAASAQKNIPNPRHVAAVIASLELNSNSNAIQCWAVIADILHQLVTEKPDKALLTLLLSNPSELGSPLKTVIGKWQADALGEILAEISTGTDDLKVTLRMNAIHWLSATLDSNPGSIDLGALAIQIIVFVFSESGKNFLSKGSDALSTLVARLENSSSKRIPRTRSFSASLLSSIAKDIKTFAADPAYLSHLLEKNAKNNGSLDFVLTAAKMKFVNRAFHKTLCAAPTFVDRVFEALNLTKRESSNTTLTSLIPEDVRAVVSILQYTGTTTSDNGNTSEFREEFCKLVCSISIPAESSESAAAWLEAKARFLAGTGSFKDASIERMVFKSLIQDYCNSCNSNSQPVVRQLIRDELKLTRVAAFKGLGFDLPLVSLSYQWDLISDKLDETLLLLPLVPGGPELADMCDLVDELAEIIQKMLAGKTKNGASLSLTLFRMCIKLAEYVARAQQNDFCSRLAPRMQELSLILLHAGDKNNGYSNNTLPNDVYLTCFRLAGLHYCLSLTKSTTSESDVSQVIALFSAFSPSSMDRSILISGGAAISREFGGRLNATNMQVRLKVLFGFLRSVKHAPISAISFREVMDVLADMNLMSECEMILPFLAAFASGPSSTANHQDLCNALVQRLGEMETQKAIPILTDICRETALAYSAESSSQGSGALRAFFRQIVSGAETNWNVGFLKLGALAERQVFIGNLLGLCLKVVAQYLVRYPLIPLSIGPDSDSNFGPGMLLYALFDVEMQLTTRLMRAALNFTTGDSPPKSENIRLKTLSLQVHQVRKDLLLSLFKQYGHEALKAILYVVEKVYKTDKSATAFVLKAAAQGMREAEFWIEESTENASDKTTLNRPLLELLVKKIVKCIGNFSSLRSYSSQKDGPFFDFLSLSVELTDAPSMRKIFAESVIPGPIKDSLEIIVNEVSLESGVSTDNTDALFRCLSVVCTRFPIEVFSVDRVNDFTPLLLQIFESMMSSSNISKASKFLASLQDYVTLTGKFLSPFLPQFLEIYGKFVTIHGKNSACNTREYRAISSVLQSVLVSCPPRVWLPIFQKEFSSTSDRSTKHSITGIEVSRFKMLGRVLSWALQRSDPAAIQSLAEPLHDELLRKLWQCCVEDSDSQDEVLLKTFCECYAEFALRLEVQKLHSFFLSSLMGWAKEAASQSTKNKDESSGIGAITDGSLASTRPLLDLVGTGEDVVERKLTKRDYELASKKALVVLETFKFILYKGHEVAGLGLFGGILPDITKTISELRKRCEQEFIECARANGAVATNSSMSKKMKRETTTSLNSLYIQTLVAALWSTHMALSYCQPAASPPFPSETLVPLVEPIVACLDLLAYGSINSKSCTRNVNFYQAIRAAFLSVLAHLDSDGLRKTAVLALLHKTQIRQTKWTSVSGAAAVRLHAVKTLTGVFSGDANVDALTGPHIDENVSASRKEMASKVDSRDDPTLENVPVIYSDPAQVGAASLADCLLFAVELLEDSSEDVQAETRSLLTILGDATGEDVGEMLKK